MLKNKNKPPTGEVIDVQAVSVVKQMAVSAYA